MSHVLGHQWFDPSSYSLPEPQHAPDAVMGVSEWLKLLV